MASTPWRRRIKALARRFGYDVIRFHPAGSEGARLLAVLRHLGTDLVLDVGANEGQFGRTLRDNGYRGRIVSFEPLSSAHAQLERQAAPDPGWHVHERCAVGDDDGVITINIAGNNVSSSLLPMLAQHVDAAPESRYVGREEARIVRLDAVAPAYAGDASSVYLKVDTQGFEAAVLRGASQLLADCRGVQLELSLTPLYEGQELWDHFVADLTGRGFRLWTVLPGFVEASTGRTLQFDAVFVRD